MGGGNDPDAPGALQVLDIADPQAPRMFGELRITPRPVALAVHGRQAMVVGDRRLAGGHGGPEPATLVRVDLESLKWPRVVDRTAVRPSALGVASDGRRAVVGTLGGDLAAYVLGDEAPRLDWWAAGLGKVSAVAADGDLAVARHRASRNQSEVTVLDVRDPRRPRPIASVLDSASVSGFALRGHVLVLIDPVGGSILLRVVDLSRPEAPVERGRIDGREQREGLQVAGMAWRSEHELLLGGRERLSLVDLTDLDRPLLVRSWAHGSQGGGLLDVEGDLALVGSNIGSSIQLVALDDRLEDRWHTITGLDSGGPIQVDLHEGRAWVSDNRDLRVIEVQGGPLGHRPASVYERLLERGSSGTPIWRWGRYLFAVEWDRLRVFDTRVGGPPGGAAGS